MKLTTILLGLVTFSIVATMMFSAVQDYLTINQFGGADEWEDLSGEYEVFVAETATNANSTLRDISDQTKSGESASDSQQIVLLEGAVSGGKLMINFFTNFDDVLRKTDSDTKTYVDPRIIPVVIAIIMIIIVLSVIFFLRGFKAET